MTKISGILPSSARVEAIDMRKERPLRPGSVSFGQPIAKATERPSIAQSESSIILQKPSQKSDTDIVKELSDSFFSNNSGRNEELAVTTDADIEYVPAQPGRLSIMA